MVGLGLFAPLPLAVMIPFMAGQSFAMGEAFGKGFQYGKRRISSMTNEKFNSMSAKDHFEETTADITAMIPTMSNAIDKFHTLQTDIILKMIDYVAQLPADVLPAITDAVGEIDWAGIIKAVASSGAQVTGSLIEDLTKAIGNIKSPLPSASASVDPRPSSQQTSITELQAAILKIAQNTKGPDFIGPTQTPRAGTSTANRITVDKYGNLTNTDTRTVTKLNLPSAQSTTNIGNKRKAGQSQKQAERLYKAQVVNFTRNIKEGQRRANMTMVNGNERGLKIVKQKLANLYARYTF